MYDKCTWRYSQVVARTLDVEKRDALLRSVIGYLETHGVNDLSLAPLAEAIGTSKRMLLYYFGDKNGLLTQALDASRPNVSDFLHEVDSPERLTEASMSIWHALTRGRRHRAVPVLLQVLSLAGTDPDTFGTYARHAVEAMVIPLAQACESAGIPPREAPARATLLVSGLRGLAQDLVVTGDRERLDAAAKLLIAAAVHGGGK